MCTCDDVGVMAMDSAGEVRVLVVDDDVMLRSLLKVILHDEGFTVVGEAEDGVQAIALCRELMPSVMCLDVNMPGMSGLQTLRQLRSEGLSLPVVMVSADSNIATVRDALSQGASGYIVKPFNARRVGDAVRQAMAAG